MKPLKAEDSQASALASHQGEGISSYWVAANQNASLKLL